MTPTDTHPDPPHARPRPVSPTPLVHTVVPNWNQWQQTLACLESLRQQDYPAHHVLVVDNHSTDDSAHRLGDPALGVERLTTRANLGYAAAANLGIRRAIAADADYVWLINNDTRAAPDTLSVMVAAMCPPRVAAVGCRTYDMRHPQQIQTCGGGWYNLRLGVGWTPNRPPRRLDYICGTSVLLRVRALQEVGLLDERYFFYFEDTDLSFRLRRHGWELALADQARLWHAGSHSVGQGSYRQGRYFGRGYILFLRTHARVPLIPALMGGLAKVLLDAVRGRFRSMGGFLVGWLSGWRMRG